MNRTTVHEQLHGYRKGHQLLSASLVLDSQDQDAVNSLSDLTGRLRPGQLFEPYLTAYPLPSRAYYIIARTFQDREAPRSGCVLTRSLFIPMDSWGQLTNLGWLLAKLGRFRTDEEARVHDEPADVGKPPKEVCDGRVAELVQALFLDKDRPIVIFDAPEADLIATRLLMALWPSLRRRFSICTLALGPRRLDEQHFNLVFAPTSARSRFSGEAFFRIGVRESIPSEAVHRLAAPTAARIFQSDAPSLAATMTLRLLSEDELGDRAAVRTVMRWEELTSRAKTSPTAALGMLDILNSRGGPDSEGWNHLSPVMTDALELVSAQTPSRESWEFLFALNAKVDWTTAPGGLAGTLENAARSLARSGPEDALESIEDLRTDLDGSAALLKGVGDGVAESSTFDALSECLNGLVPDALLELIDSSDRLCETLARAMNGAAPRWFGIVGRALEGKDEGARRRARRRFMSLVDDAIADETVPGILADVTASELTDLVVEMGRRGRFRSEPIIALLAEAAQGTGSVDIVRDAVASGVQTKDVDGFLLKTLNLTEADLEWLLGVSDGALRRRLLTALLVYANDSAIRSVLSRGDRASRTVSVLQAALPESAPMIAKILKLGLIQSGTDLDIGFEVVSEVPEEERGSLEKWLLREVLSTARAGDARVGQAIAEFGTRVTSEELVAATTAASIGRRRMSENLVALNGAPHEVRDGVVGIVDVLTRHVVERPWEKLEEAAYRAWARMLADARGADSERRIRAAGTVFGFALRHVTYPASALVVSGFPTVYREIAKLKELARTERDLSGLPYYPWTGWKKPKEGRRETIDAMVRAFFHSAWPPADLMVAALAADVGEQVVERVRKRYLGERFLEKIVKDAARLDDELRRQILACIADTR